MKISIITTYLHTWKENISHCITVSDSSSPTAFSLNLINYIKSSISKVLNFSDHSYKYLFLIKLLVTHFPREKPLNSLCLTSNIVPQMQRFKLTFFSLRITCPYHQLQDLFTLSVTTRTAQV